MILNDEQLAQDAKSLEAFRMAAMGNSIYLREGLVRDLFETIADLKRQLAVSAVDVMEAVLEMMGYGLPQDEPIDIRLVRKSLDAYVQEKVDYERGEIAAKLDLVADGYKAGGHSHRAQMLHALSGEIRAKMKT